MIARLAVIAALAGSGIGAAVVLADDRQPPAKPVPVVAATATPTPAATPVSNAQEVLRTADPRGGAPWVVRRFDTNGHTCFGLARAVDGRLGWLNDQAFTTTGQLPVACPDKRLPLLAQRFTLVAGSTPTETVTWGAGPGIKQFAPIDEPPLQPDANGVFLRITPGEGPASVLQGPFVRTDGTRGYSNRVSLPPRRGDTIVPGSERVAAEAPDPAGGLPWGVIAATATHGGTCLSLPGSLVGTRLGYLDPQLGITTPAFFSTPGCAHAKPTRAFPLRLDTEISGGDETTDQGRIERRVLNGRIIFWGAVDPSVDRVTITTPRDVRTLVPTKDHAILAVYDGLFPGGTATATARLRDGREVTRTLHVE